MCACGFSVYVSCFIALLVVFFVNMSYCIRNTSLFGPSTCFISAPCKGAARAEAKTRVTFLNDASQLTDCVRGTIVLDLPPKQPPEMVEKHAYESIL